MRSIRVRIIIGALAFLAPFVVGAIGVKMYRVHQKSIQRESWATTQTAQLIIAYMQHNQGRWPRGWRDLASVSNGPTGPWSLAELKDRIVVDWQADPRRLLQQTTNRVVTFTVVSRKDGKQLHVQCPPNDEIFLWLEWKRDKKQSNNGFQRTR
ncbi:hypothetical protein ACFLQR_02890 [Verrucomicrobiota bacterium]